MTNLPRIDARSRRRPSAAFDAISETRPPTVNSRKGKTSSGMMPMSRGTSLRPPGISGTTTSARVNAIRADWSPPVFPEKGSFRT